LHLGHAVAGLDAEALGDLLQLAVLGHERTQLAHALADPVFQALEFIEKRHSLPPVIDRRDLPKLSRGVPVSRPTRMDALTPTSFRLAASASTGLVGCGSGQAETGLRCRREG
jgi:hypothetical protein